MIHKFIALRVIVFIPYFKKNIFNSNGIEFATKIVSKNTTAIYDIQVHNFILTLYKWHR